MYELDELKADVPDVAELGDALARDVRLVSNAGSRESFVEHLDAAEQHAIDMLREIRGLLIKARKS